MSAKKIAILTDSTCDLPAPLREQYGIGVVPLHILWGGKQYRDGVDMTAEEFYRRLNEDPEIPTTSQPSPQIFLAAYQQAAEAGAEQILVCTLSSAMSGTIESARNAAAQSPIPVAVHDSRTNSMGLGWQVLAAARAREIGASLEGMLEAADQARRKMSYIISLNTLKFLHAGGRIGGATRLIGTLLNIKPQIQVNHETGKVEAGIPARSRSSAIQGVVRTFFNQVGDGRPLHVAVLHNAVEAEALILLEQVREQFKPDELLLSIVSPVLGVHTGPEALALCGYAEG